MNNEISFKKRSKGLLAILIGFVLLTVCMQKPLMIMAASSNTCTVTTSTSSIILGNGDTLSFGDGVYGHVQVQSDYIANTVFPEGETGVKVYYSGRLYEKYCDTGSAYTVSGIEGLYVAANLSYTDVIVWYSYEDITGNSSRVEPDTGGGDFVYVCLVNMAGCKVDYVNDVTGAVVKTDYVVYEGGFESPAIWEPTDTEIAKDGYNMLGWSAASGSDTVTYDFGDVLDEGLSASADVSGSVLTLYPVWEAVETPSEEPSEVPSEEPSEVPSEEPSEAPSEEPSEAPSETPPATPPAPPAKTAGTVSVNMDDFRYGESAPALQVTSTTNDVSKALVQYKVTGQSDETYTNTVPTAAGNYTVRVILPESGTHDRATGTDTFSISYLKAPSPAYHMEGKEGNSGWYTSDITITPPVGYEMSVGNRDAFSTEGYVVEEETANLRIYLRQTSTGAMTDAITIANLRVDDKAPMFMEAEDGGEYYEDSLAIDFTEEHFKTAKVDGKIVEVTSEENGAHSLVIESGVRRLSHTIELVDEAGNSTKISVIIGPAWLKDGIIGEGEFYLEEDEEYHMPSGSNWSIDGDNTVYAGGCDFYANKEGEVTFRKE